MKSKRLAMAAALVLLSPDANASVIYGTFFGFVNSGSDLNNTSAVLADGQSGCKIADLTAD